MISALIDKFQATFPVNRLVALATPLVFVPISAWFSGYVAKHFPGLPAFSSAQITGIMVAGSVAALTAGYKFLDGWQKHEQRVHPRKP